MTRSLAVCVGALLASAFTLSPAATTPPAAKPAVRSAAKAKPAAKPSSQKSQQTESEAKGLAVAEEVVEQITTTQLDIAGRVLTGDADCEFNQKVSVAPDEARPGVFKVVFNKQRFTMVPAETTTGAVRLEDRRAGVMWLQIPSKSMLLNSKVGQRMVDACTQTEQRLALQAASAATNSGLLTPALTPPPSATAADAGSPVALSGTPVSPAGGPSSAP